MCLGLVHQWGILALEELTSWCGFWLENSTFLLSLLIWKVPEGKNLKAPSRHDGNSVRAHPKSLTRRLSLWLIQRALMGQSHYTQMLMIKSWSLPTRGGSSRPKTIPPKSMQITQSRSRSFNHLRRRLRTLSLSRRWISSVSLSCRQSSTRQKLVFRDIKLASFI